MTVDDQDLKAKLLTPRLPQPEEVPIPGIGTVMVRGLSRAEVLELQEPADDKKKFNFECRLVSAGMVHPTMTVEEVATWQTASMADELETVTKKISELSGLGKGAQKAAYKSV